MATVDGNLGPRVRWAFADRTDGVSLPPYDSGNLADHVGDDLDHVRANRSTLAAVVGVDAGHVVSMAPVHGNDVGRVDGPSSEPVPEVDALVTTVVGVGLLVLAADCVPVILGDGSSGVVAVVHAGWRGVRADVVGSTLESMVELGARLDRVRAVVGPAICGRCYAVPRERFDEVVAVAPDAASVAAGGHPGLDLRAAVVSTLRGAGVTPQLHGGCTLETPSLYSFRRDGVTGRHGGVVTLLPEPVPA
jgi:YfiH family protein